MEQVGATVQPVLGDKQMAGAGDGEEFSDALDDAEQYDLIQIFHEQPVVLGTTGS
jgi:hypothetical protein